MKLYRRGIWLAAALCVCAFTAQLRGVVLDEITQKQSDFFAGSAINPIDPNTLGNLQLTLAVFKVSEGWIGAPGVIPVGNLALPDVLGKRFVLYSCYSGFKAAADLLSSGNDFGVALFPYWNGIGYTNLINVNFQTYSTNRPDFLDPLLFKNKTIEAITFEMDALTVIYPGIPPPPPKDFEVAPVDPNRWISYTGTINIQVIGAAPVPEPSTYWLGAIACVGLAVWRTRRALGRL